MKENALLLLSLLCGIGLGWTGLGMDWLSCPSLPTWLLSLLVLQVGIGIGSKGDLRLLFHSVAASLLYHHGHTFIHGSGGDMVP